MTLLKTEDLVFPAYRGRKKVIVRPVLHQNVTGSLCGVMWQLVAPAPIANYHDHSVDGERILANLAESYEKLQDKQWVSTTDFRGAYWPKWDVARLQPALSWLLENNYLHKMECREICRRKHVRMAPNWESIAVESVRIKKEEK